MSIDQANIRLLRALVDGFNLQAEEHTQAIGKAGKNSGPAYALMQRHICLSLACGFSKAADVLEANPITLPGERTGEVRED